MVDLCFYTTGCTDASGGRGELLNEVMVSRVIASLKKLMYLIDSQQYGKLQLVSKGAAFSEVLLATHCTFTFQNPGVAYLMKNNVAWYFSIYWRDGQNVYMTATS